VRRDKAQGDLFAASPQAPSPAPARAAPERVLALVDANSFYASCEKAVDPRLAGRAVVVLSNNDGCAIARSPEAKALGIRMGDPWFRIRDLCAREGVVALSSNYALYGDMSRRINAVYREIAPLVEIYSIDESFLDFTGVAIGPGGLPALGQAIRSRVMRETGIPTCVGFGPSKTLAKLGNRIAKGEPGLHGVCDLVEPAARATWLDRADLAEVWGIGEARAAKLHGLGLRTVADLATMDLAHARQVLTVTGERTVRELRGVACLPLETTAPPRRNLAVTRSFGRRVLDLRGIEEAVSKHAARAAEKLRGEGLAATEMTVFAETSRHDEARYGGSVRVSFPDPTDDGREMVKAALAAAARLFRSGYRYAKAGVTLDGLVARTAAQRPLFGRRDVERGDRLMRAMDGINARFGRDTVYLAAQGIERPWRTRFERLSGLSTTRLAGLPVIDADAPFRAVPGEGWTLAEVLATPVPDPRPRPPAPPPVPAAATPAAAIPLLRATAPLTPLGRRVLESLRGRPPVRKSHVAALIGIGRGSGIRMVTRLAAEGHLVESTPGWFRLAAADEAAAPALVGT